MTQSGHRAGRSNAVSLNSPPSHFRCASLSRYDALSLASEEAMRRCEFITLVDGDAAIGGART
jgi:hypothetical protein